MNQTPEKLMKHDLTLLGKAIQDLADFADSQWDGSVHEPAYHAQLAGNRAFRYLDRLRSNTLLHTDGSTTK